MMKKNLHISKSDKFFSENKLSTNGQQQVALKISFVLEDDLQAAASPTVSLMHPWIYHLIIWYIRICTLIVLFSSAFPQEKGRNAQTFLPTVVPFLKKKN